MTCKNGTYDCDEEGVEAADVVLLLDVAHQGPQTAVDANGDLEIYKKQLNILVLENKNKTFNVHWRNWSHK